MTIGIYKITNTITNQCYIGQSVEIEKRWKDHIYESKHLHHKTKFYLALNQYGIDAFKFEVLEECPLNQEILDERERYWIEYYNSYKDGYNSTPGGQFENSWVYDSQEIRNLWDKGYSTKQITEIVGCSDVVVQRRLKGYNDYNADTSHSRAMKHRVAEGTQGGYSPVPVYQYDLNGQYIAEYRSITAAAGAFGADNAKAIYAVLQNECHTAYGFQWSREKVEFMPMIPINGGKLVRCVNTNQIFHSSEEAAKWCNMKGGSNIRACCRGKHKTAGKHPETDEPLQWEYIE